MSEKNQKLAEIFLDYLNAEEANCVNARRQIGELFNGAEPAQHKANLTALPFNVSKIPWKSKQGDHGPFELSDNYGNIDHQQLLAFVQKHAGGAITSEGFYYWIFTDGKTIGRKPSNQVKRKN